MIGLDENTAIDRDGSVYMRNEQTNELNGILLENAGINIMERAMNPKLYPTLVDEAFKGLARDGLYLLAQNGITSAVDARNYWQRENQKAWKRALNEKKLTAKIILSNWAYPEMNDDVQIQKLKDLFTNDKSSRLRQSQIKVYMDGIVTTRTAKLMEPYDETYPDLGIGNKGMNYFTEDRLKKYIEQLQNLGNGEGYNFLIHAIGDQGVHEALNAIQRSSSTKTSNTRHKLTHVELVDTNDLNRFASLGVIADPQVNFNFKLNHVHR